MRGEVRLGEWLTDVGTGWSPVCDPRQPGADEWGVLKLSAVTSGRFVESEAKALPREFTPRPALEVRTGDVLMSRANGVRELVGVACTVGVVRPRLLLPDLVFRLTTDPAVLSPEFLGIALASNAVRRQIEDAMRGSSGQHKVSQADVRDLRIPRMDVDGQEQVVAAHAAFERRIGALERTLGKLRKAEAAAVANALDAPCRVQLDTWLTRIEAGKSPLAEDTPAGDGEWGVLKVSAVQAGWFERTENKVLRDPEHVDERYEVRPGDLLMTRANTEELVGLACVVRDPGPRLLLSDKTLRLVPDSDVAEAEFIALTLASPAVRVQIKAEATGTSASMKNISQQAIRGLLVPDVPLPAQRQAVSGVSAVQRRIRSLVLQIAKLRTVQRGVVEDLLAGRVRLTAA
ncbi:hypothetical protein [Streptomyces bluensis]|uniref:restriction endonuclease subunit S n=1 Tax=Streptomyces bluensis TaxID=33897 RepID=UPI0033276F74